MAAASKKAANAAPAQKKAGTSLVDIKAELKKEADAISARISAPSGDIIRITQDKKFVLPSGEKSEGPLSVVIVDFVSMNSFHDRPYKKGEESPPACFALGVDPVGLKPSGKSPVKQAETCAECPNNEWGSRGNGKACDNLRLLAVVAPGEDGESSQEILLLKVSPTAIKAFDAYVMSIKSQFDLPPIGVVTDIYFDENLTFGSLRFGNPRPNPEINAHFELRARARDRLLTEPDVSKYTPPVKAKRK